ncbi:MAG: ubiquinone biosynthesis protein UbiH, partial [Burkholderiaceae bacterium]|nr:ubiquinone biosynthesis protein UbiH [Burkholderiaceae bacterium]
MTQSGHITVLGAGITAHAAALLLAEQGFSVSLPAPQAQPHTRDIRAYAINHTSRDTLKACGVWPQDDQAAWLTP